VLCLKPTPRQGGYGGVGKHGAEPLDQQADALRRAGPISPHDVNRRDFLKLGAIAGASTAAGVGGYTWLVEPHWEKIVERALPNANLPPSLAGARLVQLSDLHVGPRVDDGYLVTALERAAALRPDIVVVTGDFMSIRYDRPTRDIELGQLRDVLAHLPRGRLATLGILGNHDYGRNWSEPAVAARVVAVAERAGVRVLRNEVATVDGLDVIGVDDLWAHRSDTKRALDARTSGSAIALCHNPDAMDELPWGDYKGWILAGHTHGGQCKPPFLPPPMLPVRNKRYTAGEIPLGHGRRLYINRGLGHLLQVRFNARPEITAFTLRVAGSG
jgi:predicted MPP superfamily phosphohydrolase